MSAELQFKNKPGDKAEQVISAENILAPVCFGESTYNEIMHFLSVESRTLDDEQLMKWLDYLTDDMLYSVPVRQTKHRKDGDGFSEQGCWIYDKKPEIVFKMKRVAEGDSGWSGDPAPLSRRFISSVLVFKTNNPDEYFVQSNILVKRGRSRNLRELEELSGRRDDILRRTDQGWKIARRQILLDHAVLGMQNFALYF
jgi:3-phenylpropionate/cinnamic acid dioxygenase small subunit